MGGACGDKSHVDVTGSEICFRFGFWFSRCVPRADIKAVFARSWPLWYGIGWRSNLRGVIGLIGSYEGVVEVRLKSRRLVWGVFPCDRIAVSLEDPEGFIAAIASLPPAKSG